MKLTALLLVLGLMQVAARTTAQVTLKESSASLEKVLVSIKKQSHYDLFFDRALLKAKARPVVVNVDNVGIEKALEAVFATQDQLTFSIEGNIISVKEKKLQGSLTPDLSPGLPLPAPPTVHGRITNEKGEAVVGVNISIKGGKVIGVTNDNGEFTLTNVADGATLVFSAVNIVTYETKLNGRSELALSMKTKVSELDEIQVIAYGQQSKRLSVGNVSTVSGEEIQKHPGSNPLLSLQGLVPGLYITQTSGIAGSGLTVRVQGQNSISSGNDPLYVIDGVPYISQFLQNNGNTLGLGTGAGINNGNPLSLINPSDIESISVLKDADATSIYGSRAANGAILITTKKGKVGASKVDIDLQQGWSKVARKIDLMNTQEYISLRKEAMRNDGILRPALTDYDINGLWDTTRYTDWQKTMIGSTAHYSNVNTTISGGTSNIQYLVGGTFHKETTVFPGDYADNKGSMHFNINATSTNQKFKIQFTGNYLAEKNTLPINDLTTAIKLVPDAPALYSSDGTLNWMPNAAGASSWVNPLAVLNNTYQVRNNNVIGSSMVSYQIIPALEIRSNLGYTNIQQNDITTNSLLNIAPENRPNSQRFSSFSFNNINSWIVEPQLNFKHNIWKGKFDLLLGFTALQTNSKGLQLGSSGYISDAVLTDIRSATNVNVTNSLISTYKYTAVFVKLNYNQADKYILDLAARRDGSSRFGPANSFHNFGSIAGAWIFSSEKYLIKSKFLSFGKLKGSYGTTGNDQIGDYKYLNTYSSNNLPVPYQGGVGLVTIGLPNPYLQWEETRKLQIGLELGILKNAILFGAVYAQNRSSNQLLSSPLPYTTGFTGIVNNLPATVQNTSWEFTISTTNIKGAKLIWNTSFNISIPNNKLVDFPNLATSAYRNFLIIGQPVSLVKAFHYAGVDPATGIYQFTDFHGNLTSKPNDVTDQSALIKNYPNYYGGIQNSFRYKSFQFDFLFQFVSKKAKDNLEFGLNPGSSINNQPSSISSRWQKPGDLAFVQRSYYNFSLIAQYNAIYNSDAAYTDASFVRLKNISLSYELPAKTKKGLGSIQNLRLYFQAENLFVLTKFKGGIDPENTSSSVLPPLQVLTFGIHGTL